MTLMRAVQIEQPDYQWQYQLRHERDVTAQLEAIEALQNHATPATRLALTDTIENEHCYYKVRLRAAHCLTKVIYILDILSYLHTCKLLITNVLYRLLMQWLRHGLVHLQC